MPKKPTSPVIYVEPPEYTAEAVALLSAAVCYQLCNSGLKLAGHFLQVTSQLVIIQLRGTAVLSSSALGETRLVGHVTEGDFAVLSKHEVSQVRVNLSSCDANPLTLVVYCPDLKSLGRCFQRLNVPTTVRERFLNRADPLLSLEENVVRRTTPPSSTREYTSWEQMYEIHWGQIFWKL